MEIFHYIFYSESLELIIRLFFFSTPLHFIGLCNLKKNEHQTPKPAFAFIFLCFPEDFLNTQACPVSLGRSTGPTVTMNLVPNVSDGLRDDYLSAESKKMVQP